MSQAKNVSGGPLKECCSDPMTGFFRDGKCRTCPEDLGAHVVCTEVTEEFLRFSRARGNDLSTPVPEFGFPGLRPGDRWCLGAARWKSPLAPCPLVPLNPPRQGPWNADLRTPPGPEGSNGSLLPSAVVTLVFSERGTRDPERGSCTGARAVLSASRVLRSAFRCLIRS